MPTTRARPYTSINDWLASRPPPPLPRTVTLVQDETVGSYLRRLAAANHQDPDTLRRYLRHPPGPHRRHTISPHRLAAASRHPVELLTTRLHRLANTGRSAAHFDRHVRLACRDCMTQRGITEPVWCALPEPLAVCPRHHLWLGPGNSSHRHQHDLRRFPEIHHAQRRHLRLHHQHDTGAMHEAFDYADRCIQRAMLNALWTPQQRRRLQTLSPATWRQVNTPPSHGLPSYAHRHTAVHIATHPERIDLAERFLTDRDIPTSAT
jgi:hypothetical protein